MKRYCFLSLVLLFLSFIIINCADFDTFSDEADILSINIYDLDSTNINIVGKDINTANGELKLYVKGKLDKFPLELKTRFTTSANSAIFCEGDYQTLLFHTLSDSIGIMVIAQSGLPKKWLIQLSDQRNQTSDIEQALVKSHSPEEITLKDPPITVYKNLKRLELFIEEGENNLPLTVNTILTLSSKALLADTSGAVSLPDESGVIEKSFTFANLQSIVPFDILSEAGDTTRWTFALRTKYSSQTDILGFKIGNYIPSNIEFGDIRIDNLNSEVIIEITGGVADPSTFMVSMSRPEITLSPGTTISPDYSGDLNFESITKTAQITLVSENGQQRIWSFKLEYPFGSASSVSSFRIVQSEPEDITLDKAGIIDPVNHVIQLKINKGVRKLPLTLSAEATSTNGGEILDPLNKLYFKDINAKNTIRLRSANSEISLWSITLRDMESEQSSANAITGISITKTVPSGITMSPAVIKPTTHEIVLPIKKRPAEDASKPVIVEAKLNISPGAFIVNNTSFIKNEDHYLGSLRFESLAAANEIKIEAANGQTQIWKIQISYQPQTGNNIETFSIASHIPAEFKLGSFIDLNNENQSVEISITDGLDHFPLTITPQITLSENARIVSGNSFVFEKITDVVKILVMSESGQEKIWTVKLKNNVNQNTQNNIETFKVNGTLPAADIQGTIIDPAASTITVHLSGTAYPLVLSANIEVSANASILLPLYSYPFENAKQSHIISVKAQNGNVRNWKLLLEDATAQNNPAEVIKAEPISVSPVYNNIGKITIDKANANISVEIYEGAAYPTILQLGIEVSPEAKILPPHTDGVFQFTNSTSPITLQVKSAAGTVKNWTVTPRTIPQPAQEIKVVEVESSEGNIVNNIKQVVVSGHKIEVYNLIPGVQNRSLLLTFASKVRYETAGTRQFRILRNDEPYSQTVTVPLGTLSANGGQIIIFDENGATAIYDIILKYQVRGQSDQAEVTAFRIRQLRPLNASAPQISINADTREIILATDNAKAFQPFNFLSEIETSPHSLLVGISNGQLLEFDREDKTIRFNVKSESGSTLKEWTIRVQHESQPQSDKAEVETFAVAGSLPKEIKLGTPAIDKNGRVITIDVLNWVKNQTLYLTPQATFSPNAASNLPQVLPFENPNGSSEFNVTAENGRTAIWTVKLNFTAGSEADITKFTILSHLPAEVELNYTVQINKSLQEVVIPVVSNLQFPVRIRTEIHVSQGATALNIPLEYVFNSLTDIKTLQIEAEDGFIKGWKIRLGYTFNSEAEVLAMSVGTAAIPVEIGGINIKSAQQVIEININKWNEYTEFTITPQFSISQGAVIQGIDKNVTFTKKSVEEVKFTVIAEDKTTTKEWKIKLVYQESANTNLESFAIDTYTPKEILLKTSAEIDNTNAVIYIDIDKWNGNKELSVSKYTLQTADNARTINLPANLAFTKETKESISFKVRAQNDITERNWSVRLRYSEISNAVVTAFDITTTNKPALLTGSPQITDAMITIPVTRGVRDGFNSSYLIQANATINENGANRTQPVTLTFASVNDTKTFIVTDEYGQKKNWTVRLDNQASNQAELVGFDPQAFTSSVASVTYLKQSKQGNNYKIYVSDAATRKNHIGSRWPVITLDPLQISEYAAASTPVSQLAFNVNTYELKKEFTIRADDGVTSNTYTIELVYCPQIENSVFDQWYKDGNGLYQLGQSASVPCYWTSANLVTLGVKNEGTIPANPGVNLNTRKVGMLGITKIAAGSLFIGTFTVPTDIPSTEDDNLKLTKFGLEFRGRPTKLRVRYSYDSRGDQGEIWLSTNYLGNSKTPDKASADGYMYKRIEASCSMHTEELPISYKNNNPVTMIAISFTSSWEGAKFIGQEGATLIIESIELLYD